MKEVVKHFELEGIIGRTIRNIYHRFKAGQTAERKEGSGKYQCFSNAKNEKIVNFMLNKVGISYRSAGRRFNVDHKSVKKSSAWKWYRSIEEEKGPKEYWKTEENAESQATSVEENIFGTKKWIGYH